MSLVNTALASTVLATLVVLVARGQGSVDAEAAIRDAAQKYPGDVPSEYDYRFFREHTRQRSETDRLVQSGERSDALRRYMEKAALYQPYLDKIQKAQSDSERDRVVEELRKFVKQTEKTS